MTTCRCSRSQVCKKTVLGKLRENVEFMAARAQKIRGSLAELGAPPPQRRADTQPQPEAMAAEKAADAPAFSFSFDDAFAVLKDSI